MPEIIPVQVERLSVKQTGYKRNGLGVLCPAMRVRSWYVQRYVVKIGDSYSSPMTKKEMSTFSKG
jgi:hypothetical protein